MNNDPVKWSPFLRANIILAIVEEKKRGLRSETFNNEAWSRIVHDFNRLAGVTFERGQIVNQLSVIKKMVRTGNYNKSSEGTLASPDSDVDSIGGNPPRIGDVWVENNLISDADWKIFYEDVQFSAGRPYVPAPKSDVVAKHSKKRTFETGVPVAQSPTKVVLSESVSPSRVNANAAVPVDKPATTLSSSSSASSHRPGQHSSAKIPVRPVDVESIKDNAAEWALANSKRGRDLSWESRIESTKVESKLETAMKVITKDFPTLTGEEQLNVGLAMTQPSLAELFLSLGAEGRRAFIAKMK